MGDDLRVKKGSHMQQAMLRKPESGVSEARIGTQG